MIHNTTSDAPTILMQRSVLKSHEDHKNMDFLFAQTPLCMFFYVMVSAHMEFNLWK